MVVEMKLMTGPFVRHARAALAVSFIAMPVLMLGGENTPALAGSASSWQTQHYVKTRLIIDRAEWQNRKDVLMAGIHIKMDPGWKTYWRYPGDAGLPPRFDWSSSRNLKKSQVLWPAPTRYKDSAGISIGYKKEVVFPVLIEPIDPSKPIDLILKMEFAVCANICIPAKTNLQLKSGRSGIFSSSYTPILSRFLGRVPDIKSANTSGLKIRTTKARLMGAAPYLSIDAEFPAGAEGADLFIEGPEGFYLAPAERIAEDSNGTVKFKVDLTKGDDPKVLKGKTITLTLVSNTAQAQTTWRIE
jgi:DsbC/DsbD-like thiol-disulfide interchange protein